MSAKNVVDDWEGIDDSELNSKLDQLKKNATNSKLNATSTNLTTESVNTAGKSINEMLINDDDNCLRTPYAPPEPTVKILKRPTSDKVNKSVMEAKPKAPVKTLQQREQEYAEARLRILGAARSAEEEDQETAVQAIKNESSNNLINGNVNGFSDYNNVNVTSSTNFNGSNVSSTSGNGNHRNFNSINNGVSPKSFVRNYQSPQQQQQLQHQEFRRIEDNIIRLPRGPDGTTGFLLKR